MACNVMYLMAAKTAKLLYLFISYNNSVSVEQQIYTQ